VAQEEDRGSVKACRVWRTKVPLELNLLMDLKGSKEGFYR